MEELEETVLPVIMLKFHKKVYKGSSLKSKNIDRERIIITSNSEKAILRNFFSWDSGSHVDITDWGQEEIYKISSIPRLHSPSIEVYEILMRGSWYM